MRKFEIYPEQMTDDDLNAIINNDTTILKDYTFANYLEKAKMKPDMKMIFGSFFQTGEICILAGKTGVGKSILAYQIADGISKGISILNKEMEIEPQKVLYYDFELNESHIKKRFYNYIPSENFFRPDVKELLLKNAGIFDFNIINNDIEHTGAKVIIIDNITAIALKSTQDQDTAMNLMKQATMLKMEKDVSILFLAHTPKLKENKPLELYDIAGAGHIHNFIDNAIMIGKSSQDINRRYIKQVKNRNSIENDNCLIVDITNKDWLHYEFVGYEKEEKHLQLNPEKEQAKRMRLIEIAENIIGKSALNYTDFCNQYAKQYGKTFDNGKKIISQLINKNIIIQDFHNKYIINRNEVYDNDNDNTF